MSDTGRNPASEVQLEIARLVDEQAALRRVATLVARAPEPPRLFAKVAEELAKLLGDRIDSSILRYEEEGVATVVAVWGKGPGSGIRLDAKLPVDGSGVTARVLRERSPVRVENYSSAEGAIAAEAQNQGITSAVGCPIVVNGRLWGAMVVARYQPTPFPPDTEQRIVQFSELVATAIANVEARVEVERLAAEQAAFRRIATLVAEGAAPSAVFDAVIAEVAQLLGASQVALARYESSEEISILALRGPKPSLPLRVGMRVPLEGDSVSSRVRRTGRSARLDPRKEGSGPITEFARRSGVAISFGAPVVVDGQLWGGIMASWRGQSQPPPDVEARLTEFAELLDITIGNADSRDQLTASRARVLTAGDEARRRVVRDLHDGAQQRLVHTIVTLKLAERSLDEDRERAVALIEEGLHHAERANAELRDLAAGILPTVLTRGGLRAAIDSLASRLDVVVDREVTERRLPADIEASAYFVVAEALTNVVKHARARRAEVRVAVEGGRLLTSVHDDGVGGADPQGRGLLGIGDRVAALGGNLRIESPPGEGTLLATALPLPS
jgi:signal transduction histidine kinase